MVVSTAVTRMTHDRMVEKFIRKGAAAPSAEGNGRNAAWLSAGHVGVASSQQELRQLR